MYANSAAVAELQIRDSWLLATGSHSGYNFRVFGGSLATGQRLLTVIPNSSAKIRILVADVTTMSGHLVADALQRTGYYEAVTTTTPSKVLRVLDHASFDVVLMGIASGGDLVTSSGFMREVHRLHPALNIIVLLETRHRALVVEALACGARGIFCRSDRFEALCNCIRCVHAGQVWACTAELEYVVDALFEHASRAPQTPGTRPLSKREQQIALLVAEGNSNRQIAEQLRLSEHTVKNYLFRIFEKIGVSTRVGLTLHMLKQNPGGRSSDADIPVPGPILLTKKALESLAPSSEVTVGGKSQ